MTDTKKVSKEESITFSVSGHDLKALLFDLISELLYHKDASGLVFSEIKVSIKNGKNGYSLSCTAAGERWDRRKHEIRTEVKAATYNQMEIAQSKGVWRAQVVLDV